MRKCLECEGLKEEVLNTKLKLEVKMKVNVVGMDSAKAIEIIHGEIGAGLRALRPCISLEQDSLEISVKMPGGLSP